MEECSDTIVTGSILYSCCACKVFFSFVLLSGDRGNMLSILLSLQFSSSFVYNLTFRRQLSIYFFL